MFTKTIFIRLIDSIRNYLNSYTFSHSQEFDSEVKRKNRLLQRNRKKKAGSRIQYA